MKKIILCIKKVIHPKYGLFFVAIIFILSMFSKNGFRFLFKLNKNIDILKQEIKDIEDDNTVFKQKIDNLMNNPRIIEIYARTRLGMVKKDEIVYEIKE